jgi:hypothetical protein
MILVSCSRLIAVGRSAPAAILAGWALCPPASAGTCSSTDRVLYFEQVDKWDQAYIEVYGHPASTPHTDHDTGQLSYRLHVSRDPDGPNHELWLDLLGSIHHGCGARVAFTVHARLSASGAAQTGYEYGIVTSSDQGTIRTARGGVPSHTTGIRVNSDDVDVGLDIDDILRSRELRVDAAVAEVWGDAIGSGAIDYGTAQLYIRSEAMLGAPRLIWRDYVEDEPE